MNIDSTMQGKDENWERIQKARIIDQGSLKTDKRKQRCNQWHWKLRGWKLRIDDLSKSAFDFKNVND